MTVRSEAGIKIGNPETSSLVKAIKRYNFDKNPEEGGNPARDIRQIKKATV